MLETVTFSSADLNVWAEFSSDWNPIHFSEDAAQKAGYETIFVHGMAALLPFTHQMLATTLADREWVKALFRFRGPIPLNEPLRIDLDATENRVSAGLARDASPDSICVYGAAKTQSVPPSSHDGHVVELFERDKGSSSDLDSLSFCSGQWSSVALVNARTFTSVLRKRGHMADFESVRAVVADSYGTAYSMVQTSHSLIASPQRIRNLDALKEAQVRYVAHPASKSASGIVTGFKASVLVGEQVALQSESMILIRPTSDYLSGGRTNA